MYVKKQEEFNVIQYNMGNSEQVVAFITANFINKPMTGSSVDPTTNNLFLTFENGTVPIKLNDYIISGNQGFRGIIEKENFESWFVELKQKEYKCQI